MNFLLNEYRAASIYKRPNKTFNSQHGIYEIFCFNAVVLLAMVNHMYALHCQLLVKFHFLIHKLCMIPTIISPRTTAPTPSIHRHNQILHSFHTYNIFCVIIYYAYIFCVISTALDFILEWGEFGHRDGWRDIVEKVKGCRTIALD